MTTSSSSVSASSSGSSSTSSVGAGGTGGGSSASAGGGGGGGAGGGMLCAPNSVSPCYTGPPNTEGVGLCQRRGGPIEVIRPGDSVFFAAGEDHWHGATPNRFMAHIAIQEADDEGSAVIWGEHVTDEEYGAAPAEY